MTIRIEWAAGGDVFLVVGADRFRLTDEDIERLRVQLR